MIDTFLSVFRISVKAIFANKMRAALTSLGIVIGVAAVITDVVITMICGVCKQRRILPVAVMLAAFAAVHMLHISMIAVIPACGVIGACDTLCRARRRGVGK